MPDTPATLSWVDRPSPERVDEAVALLRAAADADGIDPVSEAVFLRLRHAEQEQPAAHLVAEDADARLVGYAGLAGEGAEQTAEFAVHPEHRGRGIGAAMLAALIGRAGRPLWVWAHGEHPAALRLANRFALRRARELQQLRMSLTAPIGPRPLPDGLTLRAFQPGRDEAAVVEVNNRAFSWHPEQGGWTTAELAMRQAEPWFDPAGFLLAEDRSGRLRGFHWTKIHPNKVGEVYVVGVDPDAQGGGLGAALTVAGLDYLRGKGLGEVLLYVESDNGAALHTYHRIGFTLHHTDVAFLR